MMILAVIATVIVLGSFVSAVLFGAILLNEGVLTVHECKKLWGRYGSGAKRAGGTLMAVILLVVTIGVVWLLL